MENGKVGEWESGWSYNCPLWRNVRVIQEIWTVYGPDFKVTGQGAYSLVTHVKVKNPVGSDIEKASRNGYSDIVK